MYSREETQKLKREFWVAFADKYPRKWILYDTKIKDFSFKFFVDNKKAQVLIAIFAYGLKKQIIKATLENGGNIASIPDSVYIVSILVAIVVTAIVLIAVWLFYKLLYGFLLKKLKKNYEELKKIDL